MASAAAALMAFKKAQPDPGRQLTDWLGTDPCGPPSWNGIYCAPADSSNVSHVIEMYEILTLTTELHNLYGLRHTEIFFF